MVRHPTSSLAVLLLGATVLSGCANKFGPGQLARDWSCKMREMQIAPIFPPREDVQVGDIYWLSTVASTDARAYCQPQETKDYLPLPVHLGYVPEVMRAAKAHYEARPDFPKTTPVAGKVSIDAKGGTSIDFTPAGTGAIESKDGLFTSGTANRTRVVGFPDFLSVSIDRASLGAILPVQGVFTPLGISLEDVEEASISIPVAESYGVPLQTAMEAIPAARNSSLCKLVKSVTGEQKQAGVPVLVYEVFYTRAIDVSITSKRAVALSLARDRQGAEAAALPATPSSGTGAPTSPPSAGVAASQAQIDAVTQGVTKILEARNNVPGVTFAAEQGRSATINMRRIFDRPVAIGYRSTVLQALQDAKSDACAFAAAPGSNGVAPTGPTILRQEQRLATQ